MIKSPYNFVPAPEEKDVFKPTTWSNRVSHDIPFSDGESGEIEFTITAETPIFIRNGHSKADAAVFEKYRDGNLNNATVEEKEAYNRYLSFSNIDGRYFIPGTSLKGMFRNVMEIISNSRLNKKLVDNNRFSFRDLTKNSLYMKSYKSNKVKAGWLKEDAKGNWTIEECNSFYHIHHSEVDKALGSNFRNLFLNQNPEYKTAKFKYRKVKDDTSLIISFDVKTDEEGKTKAVFNKNGRLTGKVVFTGQSSKRKEKQGDIPSGKVHEFVFVSHSNPNIIAVSGNQKEDFKFIYLDRDRANISEDWKYWRSKIEAGERIPVFFMKENDTLKHFGLAFMYKLPYVNKVHDMYPLRDYKDNFDLTETIFGRTGKESSLKGRVFWSNAFSKNGEEQDKQKEILGGPKASYFPFYLEQNNPSINGYITYQNDGTLKGFKRYPVHTHLLNRKYSEKQLENLNVFSQFKPLNAGTQFLTKIRFHNLRKVEIGALLSAITFHNQKDCYHSLGGNKPFGYGKVKIEAVKSKGLNFNIGDYILAFENTIGEDKIKRNLRELVAMASNTNDVSLDYPILDSDNRIDDFKTYKNKGLYLAPFSSINNPPIISIREEQEKIRIQEEKKRMQEEEQKEKEKENKLALSLQNSEDIKALEEFINKYPFNPETTNFRNKVQKLRERNKKEDAAGMQQVNLNDILKCDFGKDKEVLNNILRKNKQFVFSETQKVVITENLKGIWEKDKQSFFKKRKLAEFLEFPWTDIKKWLGEERAKSLYDELIKK